MSSLSSYPRTGGPRRGTPVPRAAYANVPEPLRTKLIESTAHHRDSFAARHPALDFLVPRYLDPHHFGSFFREDNDGRVYPEPGALPGRAAPSAPKAQGVALPPAVLSTFHGLVESARTLGDDETVWRFIGASYTDKGLDGLPADAYTCNAFAGEFWGVGQVPVTEEAWRAYYAIPGIWNGDGGYVAFRLGDLPQAIAETFRSGAVGQVGAQPSMVPDHYLPGGGRQLWIDRVLVSAHATFLNAAPVQRSNWNQP